MSFATLPSALRATVSSQAAAVGHRAFHPAPSSCASVLFMLSALSNSRETQHLNKITKLPRLEHSPPLKLIKSSEIDPFPCPVRPSPAPPSFIRSIDGSRSARRLWDQKALQIGRVCLTDQARRTHRLTQALARAKRRELKHNALSRRERTAWQEERQRMRTDMRAAGMWIVLSIGTATALATWRFWPQRDATAQTSDMGRRIAAKAAAAMTLPAAVSIEPTMTAPVAVPQPPVKPVESVVSAPSPSSAPRQSWWKGLFWAPQPS